MENIINDMTENKIGIKNLKKKAHPKGFFRALGPGLVTGASDNDPSGIATYSQVGAQFGYGMLWTTILCLPLMTAVQEISARIGRVTGRGIAGNMRRHYSPWLLYPVVILLLVANTINIGADIAAMGAALKLLIGGPALLYSAGFAVVSLLLQIFVPYSKYVKFLKWLTLALFAYVFTAFVVHVPWATALRHTVLPDVSKLFTPKYLTALIAILGTTISPYLIFWQASQEMEEADHTPGQENLTFAPQQADEQFRRIRLDTRVGMAFASIVFYFIVLTTAVTLHARGITDIQSSAQAAEALRPIAGRYVFWLFAAGIVGTGLLAVPVLAGSAAYAVGEAMGWRSCLERRPGAAKEFYAVIGMATLLGLALDFTRIDPIKALFWTAVINGVVAGPLLVVMMLMASNTKVMGEKFTLPTRLKIWGWIATTVMIAASIGLLATWSK